MWLPQAWLIAKAVQAMADGGDSFARVVPLAAGVLLAGVVRALLDGYGVLRSQRAARSYLTELRGRVVHSLANSSPLDRAQVASGQAASAMAEQAEAVVPWLSRYESAMFKVRCVPLVIALVVACYSWVAALILVCAAPLIPFFMAIVGWRAKSASEQQMLEIGGMNGFLLDRLRGLSTLRALGAVDATALRLRAQAESLRTRTMRVLRIAFLSSAVLELFSALGVAMVAVYVGFHLLGTLNFGAWGGRLDLAGAMFVLMLAPAFFDPLRELSAVWHDKAAGEAALKTLGNLQQQAQQIVGTMPGIQAREGTVPPRGMAVDIEGLEIAVPGHPSATEALSLGIAAGEHIALWAPSGTGKSVLLAQLAGLVAVEQGRVRMDGQALNEQSAAALRARMGWMGQQAHVFAGSAQRNVGLGREGVDADAVQRAMQLASLSRMIEQRPASSLGEGGSGLSGGEAVRLALARLAVNEHADLLLVDEPTAHLDPQTAQQITRSLLQIAQGRTLIVATHDAQLAGQMDRIVRLQPLGAQTSEVSG